MKKKLVLQHINDLPNRSPIALAMEPTQAVVDALCLYLSNNSTYTTPNVLTAPPIRKFNTTAPNNIKLSTKMIYFILRYK